MKVIFCNVPRLTPIHDGDGWRLLAPFVARVEEGFENEVGVHHISIPAGFETDLASVPRLPFTYALFGGHARKAAILHDYLYEEQAGKAYADEVFLAAMKAEGVGLTLRWVMYWAVRASGQTAYDRKR